MEESPKKIVLFDGVCNLCNDAVIFIIKRDQQDTFRFCSLQSEMGKKLCQERHIDRDKTDSIVLIDPGKAYYLRSDAVIEIAKSLKGYGSIATVFGLLPGGLRDALYNFIARNRYKWFGKKSSCMVPISELKNKFL